MRSSTLTWLVLAALCGGILFMTAQRVTDGRARLAVLDADIRKEDETIRVLKAEWSYLNQPARLEKLAKQYLDLGPMTGRQFGRVGELADRATAAVASSLPPAKDGEAVTKGGEAVTKDGEAVAKPAAPAVAAVKPPVVQKPSVQKPAQQAAVAAPEAPVVKIIRPAAPPAVKPAAPAPVTAESAPPQRDFGDVMKSLGVK